MQVRCLIGDQKSGTVHLSSELTVCSEDYHEEFKDAFNCLTSTGLCQFITEPFNKVIEKGIQFGNC